MGYSWGEEEVTRYDEAAKMSAIELIKLFLESLLEKGRTKKYIEDTRRNLTNIFVPAEAAGTRMQNWGRNAMKARIAARRDAGLSDQTVRQDVVCAKVLLHWLYKERLFPKDLLEGFELPTINEEIADKTAATKDDLDGWIKACREYYRDAAVHGKKAIEHGYTEGFRLRDTLIACTLADTAIRPVELMRVKVNQVKADADGTYIELLAKQTKTKTARKVYLSPDTVAYALNPWLEFRAKIKFATPDQGYLVCTRVEDANGNQDMSAASFSRQFRRKVTYAKKKGYIAQDKKITPYSLKRYSVETMDRVNVRAAMSITGHSVKGGLAVHGRYNKDVDVATLTQMDRAQEEAQTRIAHAIAAPVQGLQSLRS